MFEKGAERNAVCSTDLDDRGAHAGVGRIMKSDAHTVIVCVYVPSASEQSVPLMGLIHYTVQAGL